MKLLHPDSQDGGDSWEELRWRKVGVAEPGKQKYWTPEAPQSQRCLVASSTRPHLCPTFRPCFYLGGLRQLWKVGSEELLPLGKAAAGAGSNVSLLRPGGTGSKAVLILNKFDRNTPLWGLLMRVSLLLLDFFLDRCPARKRKPLGGGSGGQSLIHLQASSYTSKPPLVPDP